MLDRFNGWFGAVPYLRFDQPDNAPRRPFATLAELLMSPCSTVNYDRAYDDALLTKHEVDGNILRQAMTAPHQALCARTLWMACRDTVVAGLSPEPRAAITASSRSVFDTDWVYLQVCADRAR